MRVSKRARRLKKVEVDIGMSEYNPAPVLFRRAMAAAARARKTAVGEKTWTANSSARETDDCVIAIVLAHAAVETAWHWEQMQAGVQAEGWPGKFQRGLEAVARARGRPTPDPVDPGLWEAWLDISAWRNFLQHGDVRARVRLLARNAEVGPDNLKADLAEEAVYVSRQLGNLIATAAGTQLLFDTSWIDPAEL
jgi:hypothetical protein